MTDFTINELCVNNVYKPLRKDGVYNHEVKNFTDNTLLKSDVWKSIENTDFIFESSNQISVYDVAEYILRSLGELTTMKLHKLLYYSQAWSLVWDEKPLFNEAIEAWANGPVIKELFSYHRGQYSIQSISIGNPNLLLDYQKETVNSVLRYYGDKPSKWLIDLSHMEEPWKQARQFLHPTERGNSVITYEAMSNYYSSL